MTSWAIACGATILYIHCLGRRVFCKDSVAALAGFCGSHSLQFGNHCPRPITNKLDMNLGQPPASHPLPACPLVACPGGTGQGRLPQRPAWRLPFRTPHTPGFHMSQDAYEHVIVQFGGMLQMCPPGACWKSVVAAALTLSWSRLFF